MSKPRTENGVSFPPADHLTFPERLKRAREMAHLSQTQAAQTIGRGRAVVRRFETGERAPTDGQLWQLCQAYGADPEWVTTGRGHFQIVAVRNHSVAETAPRRNRRLPEKPSDCETCAPLIGKFLFDMNAYNKVMRAESLAELRAVLPSSSTGFKTQVSFPLTATCVFLDVREAEAKQDELDAKVRQLVTRQLAVAGEEKKETLHARACFDKALARAVREAIDSQDRDLAKKCLNWSPYFLDLLQFGRKKDLDERPSSEAVDGAFDLMREFERTFPDLVLQWRDQHDPRL